MAINEPVVLSQPFFDISYQSWKLFYDTRQRNRRYSWGMLSYWGGIVLLGIINNLFNTVSNARAGTAIADAEKAGSAPAAKYKAKTPLGGAYFWIREHIIVPAAIGTYCQRRVLWCTVPSRAVSLCILGYWVLCLIFGFVGYQTIPVNLLASNVHQYLWQSAANRAGYIAYSTMPWLWMFSQRNNIFIWATGWSYSTFNAFHRHCARLASVAALVHGVCYTVVYSHFEHQYKAMLRVHFFKFGITALVLMWVMLGSSAAFIRAKFYESFLLLHTCAAISLVYSFFAHSSVFGGSFNGYLWPLVAIWSFDRLVRLLRIIYCNIRIRFSGPIVQMPPTKVTYDRASDVVRIDVQPGCCSIKPAPGQYYHIYQPFRLKGWENHPFSLGAYTTTAIPSEPSSPESPSKEHKDIYVTSSTRCSSSCSANGIDDRNLTLTFWIRPYDGWTRRIRDQCLAAQAPISPKLLLEGPYGRKAPLHAFDTVVLFVGGTGITAALPYVLDHLLRVSSGSPPRALTTEMRLVWASKQAAFVRELCRAELAAALRLEGSMLRGGDGQTKEGGSDVEIKAGRPDIRRVVGEAARQANEGGGRSVVFVCGPAAMADAARAAVHAEMKKGCRGIEYVEDCFGW
ncbi:ferric-chelate reductase [Macrophomina phaseolina]|uniref:Ferric-chelate reductase n=1 Tax=Macrophomina phaseolina TaxID=35725 RepID=A0ABQ8FS08_9PEZI|nr:ferric-chelate reductase [Macrophomina phaseolina]